MSSSNLPDVVKQKLYVVRRHLDKYPAFDKAEEKTKVPKEFLAVGVALVVAVIALAGVGIGNICTLVGFAYPAYMSLKAIENKTSRQDDTHWLVYWVLFSFFQTLEVFVDFLLYWIPFYYAFKLALLLWLMIPQTKGATFLYEAFLKDFLKKNESRIDAAMNDAKKQATSIASEFTNASRDVADQVAAMSGSPTSKKDS